MGLWSVVDSEGAVVPYNQHTRYPTSTPVSSRGKRSFFGWSCDIQGPDSIEQLQNQEGGPYRIYSSGTVASHGHKVVFGCGGSYANWTTCRMPEEGTYNFTTGIWSNAKGAKCEKGLAC